MYLFYDADSDTLQTRTRRYARDRNLVPVIVPTWWDDEPMSDDVAEELHDACTCGGVGYAQHIATCPVVSATA